nr:MAG TPA: hypothetical protein [Caudoviricetes sp.]
MARDSYNQKLAQVQLPNMEKKYDELYPDTFR